MNDLLPEEQDPEFEELITLLRQADLNPPLIDPSEHQQIVSQARARLFPTDSEVTTPELSECGSFPSNPKALADKPPRQDRRLIHLVTMLAAVLVVAVLIGTSLLIFGPWSPLQKDRSGTAPPIGPAGTPVVVKTQAGGLEMTMKITPGPYFLSELLEVDISLTNHTQTTFQADMCHLLPKLIIIDGEGLRDMGLVSALTTMYRDQYFGVKIFPHGTSLASAFTTIYAHNYLPPCTPFDPFEQRQLQPTKTITVTDYVALTNSGHVTLAARAAFQRAVPGQNGRVTLVPAANPLDGHWPSLQISVSTQVPSDRMLSLHQQTTQAIVDVPLAARSHLLYAFSYTCSFGDRGEGIKVGKEVGNTISQPTITLQRPQCAYSTNTFLNWTYVVGAIGYTMIAGMYSY